MSYVAIDFDLWAEIGATPVTVELVQFEVSYEMNRIPSCTAVLPVGYTALPPYTASTAHTAAGLNTPLQIPLVVKVTSTATGTPRVWPAGTYVLFCGWVTGVGYRRVHNGYAMTVEGTHWLSALSFASTLSATSHPQNPTHFIFNSAIALDPSGGALTHFVARTAAQSVVTATNIQVDLWGDALLPWFNELACEDRINIVQFQAKGGNDTNDSVNHEAKAALSLINTGSETLQFKIPGGVDADIAAMAIADDIAVTTLTPSNISNTMHAMAHTTFWDKIVNELSPKFFFKLIPYPERAAIVPFIPGLRAEWNPYAAAATIESIDMSQQDMNAFLPRATRAVGYFAGHGSRAGGNLIPDDAVNDDTIGGMYVGRNDGIVILKRAPKYLSEFVIPSVFTADSTGINSVRGNAHNHPGAGTPNAVVPDPVDQKLDAEILLDELAHAMYVNELLKNRWGDIVGPVRFDISPGSTISFQGTTGSSQPPGAGEKRYGTVVRTTHFFDAQHQRCYTAFRMAHVRTEAEHNSDNYTVTAHPLYSNVFAGDYNLTASATCPSTTGSCT